LISDEDENACATTRPLPRVAPPAHKIIKLAEDALAECSRAHEAHDLRKTAGCINEVWMGDDHRRENSADKVDALERTRDRTFGIIMVVAIRAALHVRIAGHRHFHGICCNSGSSARRHHGNRNDNQSG
jgi:hypothetical protein